MFRSPLRAAGLAGPARAAVTATGEPAPLTADGPTIRPRFGAAGDGPAENAAPVVVQRTWMFDRLRGRAKWTGTDPHPGSGSVPTGFRDVTHDEEEEEDEGTDWRRDEDLHLPPSTGRQDHLVVLGGPGGTPTLGSTEDHRQHGRQIFNQHGVNVKAHWRENQVQRSSGGSGFDETLSTAIASDTLSHATTPTEDLASTLSESRVPVTDLLWKTAPGRNVPIGGHPGAMTSVPGNMTHGVTEEHSTRDSIRARFVKRERDTSNLESAKLMSNIMTSQIMSHPGAEFSGVTLAPTDSPVFHGVHNDLREPENLERAVIDTHNAREHRKATTAEELIKGNHESLVAPEMQDAIRRHGSADSFIHAQGANAIHSQDTGPPVSQAYVPTKHDAPRGLAQWEAEVAANPLTRRAVSPPREILTRSGSLLAKRRKRPEKPQKQKQIDEFFKRQKPNEDDPTNV
jgi:hypothetical protein